MQVYNTLKRRKEEFIPLKPGKVDMYVCGVTVYDYCHLGHARAYIVFDMIRRYLLHKGYRVNYVQNFTDIDDKIIRKAAESGQSYQEISEKFIQEYFADFNRLGIMPATSYPRATEHIADIIRLIEKLLAKKHAYAAGGDIYYDVRSFPAYGKLSGRRLGDNEAGARAAANADKKDPLDFALWKAAKPGEPSWPSPWGQGRPGWHIECSCMSMQQFGASFDIHGGGQDLIFPHHENEIAQSEGATGQPYVKYWLHNGFVNINDEKMSKSLGNFFAIRDILQKYDAEVLRFFILSTHYRSPINFSEEQLDEAQKGLDKLYKTAGAVAATPHELKPDYSEYEKEFTQFMDDDFNSAGAIGVLFKLAKFCSGEILGRKTLRDLGGVLGLLQNKERNRPAANNIPPEISELAEQRAAAKKNKDFALADRLRAEILAGGYNIKDTPQGFVINKI
ncbi:MAG: cysteine--tRNA ligase [Candidatus Margulisbacteria bacterium]|jgi:cysteinyl-tRNA synthetase|nr:cysteine--tRNA ligase [Candidatus Margulisiibacteriota bacterium]